jgi:hypothetical protein
MGKIAPLYSAEFFTPAHGACSRNGQRSAL